MARRKQATHRSGGKSPCASATQLGHPFRGRTTHVLDDPAWTGSTQALGLEIKDRCGVPATAGARGVQPDFHATVAWVLRSRSPSYLRHVSGIQSFSSAVHPLCRLTDSQVALFFRAEDGRIAFPGSAKLSRSYPGVDSNGEIQYCPNAKPGWCTTIMRGCTFMLSHQMVR